MPCSPAVLPKMGIDVPGSRVTLAHDCTQVLMHTILAWHLRQSDARHRAIVDAALDCVITMDGDGRVIEFNPAAERTFGYRKRDVFGRPLAEFQGLQWKFADMKMQLDAAQLLLYRAASNADRGLPSPEETAIAKAYCNKAGFEVANEALQVMGAMGYSQEELVEYCARRCRGWMIAGGSIEILKNRIAEGVFGRSFSQRQ